jgi:transcriptional regulator with XRE-family HTH domain
MEKLHSEARTLKALISDARTSQREISSKTGLSERTINDWVAGKKVPRLDNAVILARELGVSLKTLAASIGLDTTNIPDDEPRG